MFYFYPHVNFYHVLIRSARGNIGMIFVVFINRSIKNKYELKFMASLG